LSLSRSFCCWDPLVKLRPEVFPPPPPASFPDRRWLEHAPDKNSPYTGLLTHALLPLYLTSYSVGPIPAFRFK
jgi:hypothetical protein